MRQAQMLVAAFAVAALWPAAAAADPIVERDQVAQSERNGNTAIVYTLMLPEGTTAADPVPAVLRTHGWAGTGQDEPGGFAGDLLEAGYAVLTWDQRGFGQSGGMVHIDDPEFERKDVQVLIDVLAADPRIAKDGPNDPKVGMSGGSYAGGIQFVTAAFDDRVDAIAPEIAWNNLLESLIPEGVIKLGWDLALYGAGQTSVTGGLSNGPAGPQTGSYHPMIHRALAEGTATGAFSPEVRQWFADKGPDYLLGRIDAPTFIIQATTDTLFPPSQAIDNYLTLAGKPGLPLKMAWYCGGHGTCSPFSNGPPGHTGTNIIAWFDRWVKGQEEVDTGAPFEYLDDDGVWHDAAKFPVPGTKTASGSGSGVVVVNGEPVVSGFLQGSTARTSVKVPIDVDGGMVVGEPTVRITATGVGAAEDNTLQAPLFFQLVNTANGEVLGNQVTPKVIPTDGTSHSTKFTIDAVAYSVDDGDQLALEIASTAAGYEAYRGAAAIQLESIEVDVPVLPGNR